MKTVTHLTILERAACTYPTRPVFKLPKLSATNPEQVDEWESISYAQFQADVEAYATHWLRVLQADGLPSRTVVGVW